MRYAPPYEARRDLPVAQQLGQIEQGPLGLNQLSGGGETALDHDSVGRRDDPPRLVGDRARARAQPAGEEAHRSRRSPRAASPPRRDRSRRRRANRDSIMPRRLGGSPRLAAPANSFRHGAFGDDPPHRAPGSVAEREPTHGSCGALGLPRTSNLRAASVPRQRLRGRSGTATFSGNASPAGRPHSRRRAPSEPAGAAQLETSSCRSRARTRRGAGGGGWRPPRSRACSRARSR